MNKQTYLLYVVGRDEAGASKMLPLKIELSPVDLQRNTHQEKAAAMSRDMGIISVDHVFFADTVHSAVKEGASLQDDNVVRCYELHNEFSQPEGPEVPANVNDAMWRLTDCFYNFLYKALPPDSKLKLLDSIGSNRPTWDRAVYGVVKYDETGKKTIEKLKVEDLSQLHKYQKAGINIELVLRLLGKMGILEALLTNVEARVEALASVRVNHGLNDAIAKKLEIPEKIRLGTKRPENQNRNPL